MEKAYVLSDDAEIIEIVSELCGITDDVTVSDMMIWDTDKKCDETELVYPLIAVGKEDAYSDCEYFIQKPLTKEALSFALGMLKTKSIRDEVRDNMLRKIGNIITPMGMNPARLGTKYSTEAVALYVKHNGNVQFKDIFQQIAENNKTTPSAVERAMRTAIENMCQKGNISDIYAVFGNSIDPEKGKPSNAEFISMVAQTYLTKQK